MSAKVGRTARGSAAPAFVVGVDAGGSRTTAVITTANGTELGRAEGPAGAVRPGHAARAAEAILETVRRAALHAEVALPVAGAVIGAAGAGRSTEREQLALELTAGPGLARDVQVMGDVELALHAAFGPAPGIVVAAGTGSAAFARTPDGMLHRAGGYGWQLGDEGGGYWIGRRALALAAREHDRLGEWTGLTVRIIRALDLGSFDDLVRWAAAATPGQVAALAPVLLEAAGAGSGPAAEVVSEAADALATLVGGVVTHFPEAGAVAVAMVGSLLAPPSPLRDAVRDGLARTVPRVAVVDQAIDPALAAARLAAAR